LTLFHFSGHFFTFFLTFGGGHFLTLFDHFLTKNSTFWPPGWKTPLFVRFDSFWPLFEWKVTPKSDPPPPKSWPLDVCVCIYIYIRRVKNHPPRFSYRGWNSLVFGVGFSDLGMPISDFWDADSYFLNATLFLPKKKTPHNLENL